MAKTTRKPRTVAKATERQNYTGMMASNNLLLARQRMPEFSPQLALANFVSWVYIAAMDVATNMAAVPLRVYSRKRAGEWSGFDSKAVPSQRLKHLRGGLGSRPSVGVIHKAVEYGDDAVEVTDANHPLVKMLRRPNTYDTAWNCAVLRYVYWQITGNAYAVLSRRGGGNGPVEGYVLLNPSTVIIKPGNAAEGQLIGGYNYANAPMPQDYPPSEVIHWKFPHPNDPLYGYGKVQAAWNQIAADYQKSMGDVAFYMNGSRPDYIASIDGASDEALEQFMAKLEGKHRGQRSSNLPLATTGEVKITPLTWPAQNIGSTDRMVEVIAGVFGVPVSRMMANQSVAGGQSGVSDVQYLRDTILPLCQADEDVWNTFVVPNFDDSGDLFVAYDNPVPGNVAQELEDDTRRVAYGLKTINEIRERMGDEPVAGGDAHLVPSGLVTLEQALKGPQPQQSPFAGMGGMFSSNPTITPSVGGGSGDVSIQTNPKACHCGGHTNQVKAWRDGLTKSADDTAREGEPETPIARLARELNAIFARQIDAVLAAMGLKKDRIGGIDLSTIEEQIGRFSDDLLASLRPTVEAQARAGGDYGIRQLGDAGSGVSFDLANPAVAEAVQAHTLRLVGEIQANTLNAISGAIEAGVREGSGVGEIARNIRAVFDEASAYRAEMIARTESARAYSLGAEEAWKQSDVVEGKVWDLASDGCEFCVAMAQKFGNEDNPTPLDQPFMRKGSTLAGASGGVMKLNYEDVYGAPLHPNCRCAVRPVIGVKE